MLLAFTGQLGSGKDTAVERLTLILQPKPVTRVSFAAKLKESAGALFDIDPKDWETYKNDPNLSIGLHNGQVYLRNFTVRQFLQRYGTEAHRNIFGSDFWVDLALNQYTSWSWREERDYLVSDLRFQNEYDGVKKRHGVVIRLLSGNEPDIHFNEEKKIWEDRTWHPYKEVHASELPLANVDYEIDNSVRDDDFVNLDRQLIEIAEELNLRPKKALMA
jgi:hypothetical protein